MKTKMKLKGRFRNYLYWPVLATILLILLNVPIYVTDRMKRESADKMEDFIRRVSGD